LRFARADRVEIAGLAGRAEVAEPDAAAAGEEDTLAAAAEAPIVAAAAAALEVMAAARRAAERASMLAAADAVGERIESGGGRRGASEVVGSGQWARIWR
jgi:hypothetical protein